MGVMQTKESQTTEFKSSWRDEYFKWICAFANTDGGKLIIGLDDNGNPIVLYCHIPGKTLLLCNRNQCIAATQALHYPLTL